MSPTIQQILIICVSGSWIKYSDRSSNTFWPTDAFNSIICAMKFQAVQCMYLYMRVSTAFYVYSTDEMRRKFTKVFVGDRNNVLRLDYMYDLTQTTVDHYLPILIMTCYKCIG